MIVYIQYNTIRIFNDNTYKLEFHQSDRSKIIIPSSRILKYFLKHLEGMRDIVEGIWRYTSYTFWFLLRSSAYLLFLNKRYIVCSLVILSSYSVQSLPISYSHFLQRIFSFIAHTLFLQHIFSSYSVYALFIVYTIYCLLLQHWNTTEGNISPNVWCVAYIFGRHSVLKIPLLTEQKSN